MDQESDDIETLTNKCASLLESCTSSPRLFENDWAQSRLDDFRLWSAGIGATAPGHASLEWRLRSRSDVREVVTGFLGELIEKASKCLSYAAAPLSDDELSSKQEGGNEHNLLGEAASSDDSSQASGSISPWSELSDGEDVQEIQRWPPQDLLKFEMKGAETLLAQLARLSLVIRKAGVQLRWQRADLQFQEFQSRLSEFQAEVGSTSLWTPLREGISAVDQILFHFRRRLEYSFIWNSYQEDVTPYKESLLRLLTSNQIIAYVGPRNLERTVLTIPSPTGKLTPEDWNTVELWLSGLDNEVQPSAQAGDEPDETSARSSLTDSSITLPDIAETEVTHQFEPRPWPTTVMRKFLMDPNRVTGIQKRLLNANVKRRNRFEIARKNAKPLKQKPQQDAAPAETSPQPPKPQTIPMPPPSSAPQNPPLLEKFQMKAPTVARTVLSATELGSQLHLPDTKKPTLSKITVVSGRGAKMKYPRQPQVDGDRQTFECPYCCQVLPVVYAKDGWRGHVAQDLQPYSCILEDCPVPEQLFGSSKELQSHMEQAHSSDKWMCYDCSDTPQIFDSPAVYERHLLDSSNHANSFTAAQLPLLVENGKTPVVPSFEICPICHWSQRHVDFEDNFGKQSDIRHNRSTKIDDHIAEHLHSFALQALPDLDDNDTNSLQLSTSSIENNLRLLKKDEVNIQYSLSDKNLAYKDVCERFRWMCDFMSIPLPEIVAATMPHRNLEQYWIPSSRQMETINVIQSTIDLCVEGKLMAYELQGLTSTTICYFKELTWDIISDIARSRWRRTILLIRICTRLRGRRAHWRRSFQDVVDLAIRKYMPSLPTTTLLTTSQPNFVGTLTSKLVDGRCVFCNSIVKFFENLDLDVKNADFDFHPSLIGVRSSAKLGCRLCAVFLIAIDNKHKRSDYGRLDDPDWSNATWDSIPGYGVGEDTVNNYLKWRFGDYTFLTERTSSDILRFWVPEPLTEDAKQDLIKLTPSDGTQLWQTSRARLSRVVRALLTPKNFRVTFAENEHGVKTLRLTSGINAIEVYEICCARDDELAVLRWTTAYIGAGSPLSQKAMNFIQGQQAACSQHHTACVKPASKSQPTRLLDLGLDQSATGAVLITPSADEDPIQYCVLSHCWGGTRSNFLVKSNHESFRTYIEPEDIPKTFRDTFLVAKALGIRFIWIDALCIIQDSREDWENEASRLLDYFENSVLNIVAAASGSSQDGFLTEVVTSDMYEHKLVDAVQKGMEIPRREWHHALHLRPQTYYRDRDYPLYGRAWAFQELLLSPRVLALQSDSIVWSCNELTTFDTGNTRLSEFWQFMTSVRRQLATGKNTESSLCGLWLSIIEFYSQLQVSLSSDRLVAISGVAKRVARLVKLRYVAGLWREDMVRGLLWAASKVRDARAAQRPRRLPAYIAPTWSWASIDCQVIFDIPWAASEQSRVQIVADVLDIQLLYPSSTPYSGVSDGWVLLRASVMDPNRFFEMAGDTYVLALDDETEGDSLQGVLFLPCLKLEIDSKSEKQEHLIGLLVRPLDVEKTRAQASSAAIAASPSVKAAGLPSFAGDNVGVSSNLALRQDEEEHSYRRIGRLSGITKTMEVASVRWNEAATLKII